MTSAITWQEANERHLSAAIAEIETLLRRTSTTRGRPNGNAPRPSQKEPKILEESALDRLCDSFGLNAFERGLLVLCAAHELNPGILDRSPGEDAKPGVVPTLGLALRVLPGAHWSALSPGRPLRAWKMIEMGAGGRTVDRPLHLDERILHYLKGIRYVDERLRWFVRPVRSMESLASSDGAVARVVAMLNGRGGPAMAPLIQICGPESSDSTKVAVQACSALGIPVFLLNASDVPVETSDRRELAVLWEREVVLAGCALVVEVAETPSRNTLSLLEELRGPVLVATRDAIEISGRPAVSIDVQKPTRRQQRQEWMDALGDAWSDQVDEVLGHFEFGRDRIRAAALAAFADDTEDANRLWRSCRIQGRKQMAALAQRIESGANWADLILPPERMALLHTIADQVHRRHTVYEEWGIGQRDRGRGITVLFAGASGTGKSLSAEVIASTLDLDLYRVDLSGVVSKYVGETEKNLRRVFDAAEGSGAILLFDEADALFGRRSEVKDSHDRYANIEVSYLLQRMEAYGGLAILTTNMKALLDHAFLRRIRFIVEFPFPDAPTRLRIWKAIFPDRTPLGPLDYTKLARLNVSGGTIRNIAVNAAFLAAAGNDSVQMKHLQQAARWECEKLDRPATESEVGAWT